METVPDSPVGCGSARRVGAPVRLHERVPRRGQLDCHGGLHRRAQTCAGGVVRGILQLHRDFFSTSAWRPRWARASCSRAWWIRTWCLAPWWAPSPGTSSPGTTAFPAALARPHRRHRGRGDCQGRCGCWSPPAFSRRWRSSSCPPAGVLLGSTHDGGGVAWVFRRPPPARWISGSAACSWFLPGPTAWATAAMMRKDHRHHLAAADCHRLFVHGLTHRPHLDHHPSCYVAIGLGTMFGGWRIVKPWGRRSPNSNRWAASVPKPVAR